MNAKRKIWEGTEYTARCGKRSIDISEGNSHLQRRETFNILETKYALSTESFGTNRTVLRSFFVVITGKIREREEEKGGGGGHRQVGGCRKESVMAEGSGAYKWHEWKRSFPRIMRGPRGVGFQGKC